MAITTERDQLVASAATMSRARGWSIYYYALALVWASSLPFMVWAIIDTFRAFDRADVNLEKRLDASAIDIAGDTERWLESARDFLEMLVTRPAARALQCEPWLDEYVRLSRIYSRLFITDAAGATRCVAGGDQTSPLPGEAVLANPAFQEAARANGFRAGPALIGLKSKQWITLLSYPIARADGGVVGYMFMSVPLARLAEATIRRDETDISALIVDGDGRIMARWPSPDLRIGALTRAPGTDPPTSDGKITIRSVGEGGAELLVAQRGVKYSNWVVVSNVEREPVLRDLRRQVFWMLAAMAGILLLLSLTAVLGARAIARPIQAVADAAKSAATGISQIVTPRRAPAEVNDMAQSLVGMAKKIAASEAQFRAIIDSSPVPCVLHASGRALFLNKAFVEKFGYVPDDIPDVQTWGQLAFPSASHRRAQHSSWRDLVGRLEPGQSHGPDQILIRTKAGVDLSVLAHVAALEMPNLDRALLSSYIDISDRIAAESKLTNILNLLRLTETRANIASWEFDPRTRYVTLSPQWYRMFDFDDKMQLKTLDQVFATYAPEDMALIEEVCRQVVAGKQGWDIELERHTATGRLIWVRELAEAIVENGNVTKIIGHSQDVTERRALESQLRQSDKMAALGQLAGGVAHDFNNILAIVGGNAELGLEASHDKRVRRYLDRILKSANLGADLVARLLTIARPKGAPGEGVKLRPVLDGLLSLVRRTLGGSIEVVIDVPDDCWSVLANASELETALLNLVINARDAMPNGGRIDIGARNQPKYRLFEDNGAFRDCDMVAIAVADQGAGMPEEIRRRALEPFFTTKAPGKGTGLGLAMVHGFARSFGGLLDIESHVGIGTTVKIFLCRHDDVQSSRKKMETPAGKAARRTVLLLDDNVDLRVTTAERLAHLGFTVVPVATTDDARKIFNEDSSIYTLLFDQQLGGSTSGSQLAHELCQHRPNLKVVITSGFVSTRQALNLQPGWVFLPKPSTIDELRSALTDAADQESRLMAGAQDFGGSISSNSQ